MSIQLWQRLDAALRVSIPTITTFLFILIGVIAWPVPYLGQLTPLWSLIALYYWSMHRPDLFGNITAFAAGLLFDAANFIPCFGLSAVIYVVLRQLLVTQRRFFVGHGFFMMWCGFALTTTIALIGQWFCISILQWRVLPLSPIFLQGMITVILFPLPAWLLIRLQRDLLPQE